MDIKHNSKKHYHQFFADMQEVRTAFPTFINSYGDRPYGIDKALLLVAENHSLGLDILMFRSVLYNGQIFILAKVADSDTYIIVEDPLVLQGYDQMYQRIFDVGGFKVLIQVTTHSSPKAEVKPDYYILSKF